MLGQQQANDPHQGIPLPHKKEVRVSEQFLKRAASSWGVPVSIHRVIPGLSTSYRGCVIAALESSVQYMDEMSLIPDFSEHPGPFRDNPCEGGRERGVEK